VRTVSLEIRVPRVIRLLFYNRVPKNQVKLNRRNIYARDGSRCQYCGKRFSSSELSLDHVVPRAQGGKASWTNIVCACTECNKKKGGRTPRQAGMKLTRKPTRPSRSPVLALKLMSGKYEAWKDFVDDAYWSVTLK
jgi:5-methylcytosine-specific restriction endonuclease McrA